MPCIKLPFFDKFKRKPFSSMNFYYFLFSLISAYAVPMFQHHTAQVCFEPFNHFFFRISRNEISTKPLLLGSPTCNSPKALRKWYYEPFFRKELKFWYFILLFLFIKASFQTWFFKNLSKEYSKVIQKVLQAVSKFKLIHEIINFERKFLMFLVQVSVIIVIVHAWPILQRFCESSGFLAIIRWLVYRAKKLVKRWINGVCFTIQELLFWRILSWPSCCNHVPIAFWCSLHCRLNAHRLPKVIPPTARSAGQVHRLDLSTL